MSNLDDLLDKAFPKMKKVAIERLQPPMAPRPPEPIHAEVDYDNLDGYDDWCKATETKRFYYFTKMGKVHRGSTDTMWTDLKHKEQAIKIVEEYKRGTKKDWKECMEEMKIVLKERKEVVEKDE